MSKKEQGAPFDEKVEAPNTKPQLRKEKAPVMQMPNVKQPEPKGIFLSNEAWNKVIGDLSVFRPMVVEIVAKTIQQNGELKY